MREFLINKFRKLTKIILESIKSHDIFTQNLRENAAVVAPPDFTKTFFQIYLGLEKCVIGQRKWKNVGKIL